MLPLPAEPPGLEVRVLMVDDEPSNLLVLEAILGGLGHELVRAPSGEEAVRLVSGQDFAAVLLDVRLGGMTGFEAARQIRAEPWGREVVICALTGYGREQDRQLSREVGIDHHLVKPVDPQMLVSILAQ